MAAIRINGRSIAWLVCLVVTAGCGKEPIALSPLPSIDGAPALTAALEKHHQAAAEDLTDGARRGEFAIALDANGFDEEAIAVYGAAARLAPDEFDWPYFQALLLVQVRSDYEQALTSIEAAIEVDEGYVPAWLSRGAWLRALDRHGEARQAYERAAALGAGAPAVVGLAHLHLDEGQFQAAVDLLEPVNATTPDPRLEALLGRAYRALGRDDEAKIASARGSAATTAMQWIDPKLARHAAFIAGFSNRLLHAQNLIQAGRPRDAMAIAESLVEDRPQDIAAINTLVWANAALERFDTVETLLADGLELYPDDARLHQMMANVFRQQGDIAGAERHLELVLASEPNNPRALEELGWLIARQGRADEGRALLERALDNGAREPKEVLYRLGLLYGTAGDWEAAVRRFHDATQIDASFTMAYVHLARCLAESGEHQQALAALDWADRLGAHSNERRSARRRLSVLRKGLE